MAQSGCREMVVPGASFELRRYGKVTRRWPKLAGKYPGERTGKVRGQDRTDKGEEAWWPERKRANKVRQRTEKSMDVRAEQARTGQDMIEQNKVKYDWTEQVNMSWRRKPQYKTRCVTLVRETRLNP